MVWIVVLVLTLILLYLYNLIGELREDLRRISTRLAAVERVNLSSQRPEQEPATPQPAANRHIPAVTASPSGPEFVPLAPAAAGPAKSPPSEGGWEQVLAKNWLVWLGGVILALGGAFLVKVSIDYGLLQPPVRVFLGICLGLCLAILAEFTARRELPPDDLSGMGGYAGPALAAAGSSTIFASVYAGYALYDLIGATWAFIGLCGAAVLAALLSLRHGAFVAGLGIIASYVVPLLVRSPHPDALNLFAYLAAVSTGAIMLLRHQKWPWLATICLAGTGTWCLLWLVNGPGQTDCFVISLFLIFELVSFAAFRNGVSGVPFLSGKILDPVAAGIVRTAFASLTALMAATVITAHFADSIVVSAFVGAAIILGYAAASPELDELVAIPGCLLALLLALWPLPAAAPAPDAMIKLDENIRRFLISATASAVLLGIGGYLAMCAAPRKSRWAALAAASFPTTLALSYWRLHERVGPYGLPLATLAAAALLMILVERLARITSRDRDADAALAAFSVGVVACTALACTMVFRDAWLTVALSVHLPAFAWIERQLNVPALRKVTLGFAGVVLIRLIANWAIVDYPLSDRLIFNWLLYGYGLPFIAFVAARRMFADRAEPELLQVLETGAIALLFALVTLELRHAMGGSLVPTERMGFTKDAMQACLWLLLGGLLMLRGRATGSVVLEAGGIVIVGLGTATVVLWLCLIENPVLARQDVGPLPLVNSLALGYALPALVYSGIAWFGVGTGMTVRSARVLAVGLALLWMSLEIRHGFHGRYLIPATISQAELYAYSVGWLLFAVICLALGLVRRSKWLRHVGFVGIGLIVLKVFLFDMSALQGLWRALSFIGLGAVLIGIGHAYRRIELVARPS